MVLGNECWVMNLLVVGCSLLVGTITKQLTTDLFCVDGWWLVGTITKQLTTDLFCVDGWWLVGTITKQLTTINDQPIPNTKQLTTKLFPGRIAGNIPKQPCQSCRRFQRFGCRRRVIFLWDNHRFWQQIPLCNLRSLR